MRCLKCVNVKLKSQIKLLQMQFGLGLHCLLNDPSGLLEYTDYTPSQKYNTIKKVQNTVIVNKDVTLR